MEDDKPSGRENTKLKAEIAELKRVQIVIIKAIAAIEAASGDDYMEAGEYHGLSFD